MGTGQRSRGLPEWRSILRTMRNASRGAMAIPGSGPGASTAYQRPETDAGIRVQQP